MASGDSLGSFGAQANQPPATLLAGIAFRTNGREVLAYDSGTAWAAIFVGTMPRHYGGGNIVVDLDWTAASATSGTGGWDVTFERNQDGGADEDADNWATAQTVTAATVPGTAGIPKRTSVTCTAGAAGTASIAAGDTYRIRIRRDVANDNAAGDLHLDRVNLREA
jgi:hypothetical protein